MFFLQIKLVIVANGKNKYAVLAKGHASLHKSPSYALCTVHNAFVGV